MERLRLTNAKIREENSAGAHVSVREPPDAIFRRKTNGFKLLRSFRFGIPDPVGAQHSRGVIVSFEHGKADPIKNLELFSRETLLFEEKATPETAPHTNRDGKIDEILRITLSCSPLGTVDYIAVYVRISAVGESRTWLTVHRSITHYRN